MAFNTAGQAVFYGYGKTFSSFEHDDDRPTLPPPGSAQLIIKNEIDALFFSATWVVRARIDGKIYWESPSRNVSYPPEFVAQWARYLIRKKSLILISLGIDIKDEYTKVGGLIDELSV